jgi:uncharacterized membrane protein (DUF373 family)
MLTSAWKLGASSGDWCSNHSTSSDRSGSETSTGSCINALAIDLDIRRCKERREQTNWEVVTAQAIDSSTGAPRPSRLRELVAEQFGRAEDVVYVVLGLLLACTAGALLVNSAISLVRAIADGNALDGMVTLVDRMLLVLMVVELLYTVQVSFRAHALVPEPFLIVGLIAVIRRILVVTATVSALMEKGQEEPFRWAMIELALLTLMVVALVISLRLLHIYKKDTQ